MNIKKAVIKEYESLSLKELLDAPVHALAGVSEGDAKHLEEAFNVKTVGQLADLKYARWARAIKDLADQEG